MKNPRLESTNSFWNLARFWGCLRWSAFVLACLALFFGWAINFITFKSFARYREIPQQTALYLGVAGVIFFVLARAFPGENARALCWFGLFVALAGIALRVVPFWSAFI